MSTSSSNNTPQWSTLVPQTSTPSRSPIYRTFDPTSSPLLAFDGCYTLYEILRRGKEMNPLGPCLGYRAVSASGFATPFVYSTYTECVSRVDAFAAGLDRLGLIKENEDGLKLLGFYLNNCTEWVLAEHATYTIGGTTVPFYATLGPSTVEFILNQTSLTTVLCTRSELPNLIKAKQSGNCPHFTNVILVNGVTPAASAQAEPHGIQLLSYAKVEAVGAQRLASEGGYDDSDDDSSSPSRRFHHTPPSSHSIATFCYTSGTTGNPKGALLTHGNIIAAITGLTDSGITMSLSDRHLSYMPLAHVFERVFQGIVLAVGGSIGFFRGDPTLLVEDIVACRPTVFIAAPRVLGKIYDKIVAGVSAAGGAKKALFDRALRVKTENLERRGSLTHAFYDALLFNKIKRGLGLDCVKYVISGSAPLSPPVMIFWRCMLGVPVVEGYGQTEGAAAATIGHADDMTTVGHVGGVHFCAEICLEDVPEMGYSHTDTDHRGMMCRGRGEILVRGPNIFKGYYKEPEKTREAIDEDGWLHSGDIGLWTMQGQLKIIDRKKNIFKLAQGEYVAPEKIENVITSSPLVAQAFVHGDSFQRYLVAVIVPDEEVVMNQQTKYSNNPTTFRELCRGKELKSAIVAEIKRVASESQLMGFEIPRAIHLDDDLFSVENGLLTPTFKVKRTQLKEKYQGILDALYEELATVSKL